MVKRHQLLSFFLITFGITWGLVALTLPFGQQLSTLFGELGPGNPIYHIAVYAPAIAAFVVIGVTKGCKGVWAYLRRFLHWKVGIHWYLLVLVGIPTIQVCVRFLSHLFYGTLMVYSVSAWYMIIPTALWNMVYIPGPVEEIGWRGFALPVLQSRYNALVASLILGVIWAVWHFPAFFMVAFYQEGGNVAVSFTLFILSVSAISVLMTIIYNGAKGSIPMAFLTHWMFNDPYQLGHYPTDAAIFTGVLVVVAVIAILIRGYKNLGRAKWTEILPMLGAEQAEL